MWEQTSALVQTRQNWMNLKELFPNLWSSRCMQNRAPVIIHQTPMKPKILFLNRWSSRWMQNTVPAPRRWKIDHWFACISSLWERLFGVRWKDSPTGPLEWVMLQNFYLKNFNITICQIFRLKAFPWKKTRQTWYFMAMVRRPKCSKQRSCPSMKELKHSKSAQEFCLTKQWKRLCMINISNIPMEFKAYFLISLAALNEAKYC